MAKRPDSELRDWNTGLCVSARPADAPNPAVQGASRAVVHAAGRGGVPAVVRGPPRRPPAATDGIAYACCRCLQGCFSDRETCVQGILPCFLFGKNADKLGVLQDDNACGAFCCMCSCACEAVCRGGMPPRMPWSCLAE